MLEADWTISDISSRIMSGADVSSELEELEGVLSSTLKHSSVGVALRAELLIRLGQLQDLVVAVSFSFTTD